MKDKKFTTVIMTVIFLLTFLFCSCTENMLTSDISPDKSILSESLSDDVSDSSANVSADSQVSDNSKIESSVGTGALPVPSGNTITFKGNTYKIIEVDGGNRSGHRESNVAVDIGFGNRVYWGYTNQYGQLIGVTAEQIIIQDDHNEPVNKNGRYYDDEANVPGTERVDLDQGHVIADSLGGVSNAYNITPQDSTLNRHGDQAYMEKVIRDAGGCKNFVATITYPNTSTQIPSHYHFEYDLKGNHIVDDFDNKNPSGTSPSTPTTTKPSVQTPSANAPANEKAELAKIDTNGNGVVTIAEAKAAGFKMPITRDHWLYKYMKDADGDGMVGE